jgi:hypothetical protein
MKKCSYCGRENPDDAVNCHECGLDEWEPDPSAPTKQVDTANEGDNPVLLTTCAKLAEADLIVSRLAAAGIEAFIPDEQLMQNVGFNLNTYGYVRVQVRQQDYDAAKELLSAEKNVAKDISPALSELDGKKVIFSTEASQTGEILDRLKKAGVPVSVRTTTEESGLDMSEIAVDDAFYDRGCDVVEAWSDEKVAESKEKGCCTWCRKCGSRNIQTIPHDTLGYCYKCKDCGDEFPY